MGGGHRPPKTQHQSNLIAWGAVGKLLRMGRDIIICSELTFSVKSSSPKEQSKRQ